MSRRLGLIKATLRLWARGCGRADSGAVSPIFALMLIPLLGGLGMGIEASNWYLTQRAMQNAADSAAIAAATNGTTTACTTVGDFCYEAKAAAGRLGYTDGSNNVTVTPAYLTSGCPSPVKDCYQVTITKNLPLELLQVVGYKGTTGVKVGTTPAQQIQVVSIARTTGPPANDCLIATGTQGKNNGTPAFKIAGGSKADLEGCSVYSNGSADCTNGGQGIDYAQIAGSGTSKSCGTALLNQPLVDPYSTLSNNIPSNPCGGSYPGAFLPPTGSSLWNAPVKICGNATITANTNVTVSASGAELIIYNGTLNLNGGTLATSSGGSMTIIFTGPSTDTVPAYPTGSGASTVDIQAPTSGVFSGVAIMQDSGLVDNSQSLDMSYSGNSPTLDVQGLIYMPNGAFSISGAINFHQTLCSNGAATGCTTTTDGLSCIGVVANTISVNGTGAIFDHSNVTAQCQQAGLTLPGVPGTGARLALVQ